MDPEMRSVYRNAIPDCKDRKTFMLLVKQHGWQWTIANYTEKGYDLSLLKELVEERGLK